MKVIIVGPGHPLRGGIANFNEALCRSFIQGGEEASIYSFSLQYPKLFFPGKTQYDDGAAPGDITIKTKINSINPFNWWKVASTIRKEKPDLVIVRFWLPFLAPCLGTIVRLIKKDKKIKVIAITDNVIPHEKRIGDNAFIRYFVKACDAFVVMSKAVLNDLTKFTDNPNKIFSPHPVYDIFGDKIDRDEARKKLSLEKKGKYVLFFGFIRKYKGLDLLLEAMNDDKLKTLGIKLIVAGEFYEDEKMYQKMIKDYALKDSVILHTHYIPSEEVKNYFSAVDMVVQPYRSATQSGVTQIAYHFDLPMLVTDVGGLSEMVPHNKAGYVVPVSPKAIASALFDFYTHDREKAFKEEVNSFKKNFEWPAFVANVKSIYRKLI